MSDSRHYFIRCDVQHCTAYVMGDMSEPPNRIRKRIAGKKYGWVSRPHPPTAEQRRLGIQPTWKDDFCPFHAYEIDTPVHTAAQER